MGGQFPRGAAAIAGIGHFGMGEAPGYSSLELATQSAKIALHDAGVRLDEVDGLFICLPDDFTSGLTFAEYLGLSPRFTDNNRTGGSAFMSHVITATMMIKAGYLDCALIAYGSNQRTRGGRLATHIRYDNYDAAYRPIFPVSGYALAAARHMHDYGTTREQLAAVAVAARGWANTNPEAFAKGPLTIDDVLSSRMISSPISARDCCLVTDGGAAIVLMATDRARQGPQPLVPVLGGAAATWWNSVAQADDLTVTAAAESGPRALAAAGVGVSDIDVVELYDAFTINTILFLEDLGFVPKGEGGRFVADGHIAPGGSLPVNTNGGGLSCCHPGMYGLFTIIEAVRQIRGTAANQMTGLGGRSDAVNLAMAHGNGGVLGSQATVILGSAATL